MTNLINRYNDEKFIKTVVIPPFSEKYKLELNSHSKLLVSLPVLDSLFLNKKICCIDVKKFDTYIDRILDVYSILFSSFTYITAKSSKLLPFALKKYSIDHRLFDPKISYEIIKSISGETYIETINKNRSNSILYCNLAKKLFISDQIHTGGIEAFYLKAILLDQNNSYAYSALADFIIQKGDFISRDILPKDYSLNIELQITPKELYLIAIALDAYNDSAYVSLANLLSATDEIEWQLDKGEKLTCEQLYLRALDLNSNNDNAYIGLGNFTLKKRIQMHFKELKYPQDYYLKAIEINPLNPYIYLYFGLNIAKLNFLISEELEIKRNFSITFNGEKTFDQVDLFIRAMKCNYSELQTFHPLIQKYLMKILNTSHKLKFLDEVERSSMKRWQKLDIYTWIINNVPYKYFDPYDIYQKIGSFLRYKERLFNGKTRKGLYQEMQKLSTVFSGNLLCTWMLCLEKRGCIPTEYFTNSKKNASNLHEDSFGNADDKFTQLREENKSSNDTLNQTEIKKNNFIYIAEKDKECFMAYVHLADLQNRGEKTNVNNRLFSKREFYLEAITIATRLNKIQKEKLEKKEEALTILEKQISQLIKNIKNLKEELKKYRVISTEEKLTILQDELKKIQEERIQKEGEVEILKDRYRNTKKWYIAALEALALDLDTDELLDLESNADQHKDIFDSFLAIDDKPITKEKIYKYCLQLESSSEIAYYGLAEIEREKNEKQLKEDSIISSIRTNYLKAIAHNPSYAQAYYRLGTLPMKKKKVTLLNQVKVSQYQLLIRAIQLGIQDPKAYRDMALEIKSSYLNSGIRKAVKLFGGSKQYLSYFDLLIQAFQLNPTDPQYLKRVAEYLYIINKREKE